MYYPRLKDLREDNDYTQKQIAEILKIHQTTYSDYEIGNLNIPVDVLIELAKLYNTSIDYILNEASTLENVAQSKEISEELKPKNTRCSFKSAGSTIFEEPPHAANKPATPANKAKFLIFMKILP